MGRKSFFKERSAEQSKKCDLTNVYRARGLAEKIAEIGDSKVIAVRTSIIPARFYNQTRESNEAARKCYKHGDFIALSQPKTQGEAFECREIPLAIRARDFGKLEEMREEEINYVGYTFRPVQGNDRRKRVVPFVWILEGARLFAYAENFANGIEVKPYADAKKARFEGADIVCRVPSRQKGKPRYSLRLKHVPVEGSTERRAVCWSLSSEYPDGNIPEHILFNIKYNFQEDAETSNVFTFYPQDIATYIAVIKHYNKEHNLTPIEMSPIALPSKKMADFYTKLCNNVLIYDPRLTAKDNPEKLRKLNLTEKSIVIARAIGRCGHDETMFWDPERDGKLRDYSWGIKKE